MKPVTNREIARMLSEIGVYLEMERLPFRPRAYEKAAEAVREMSEEVAALYGQGGIKALEEIPDVGKAIALKIEEMVKTGRLRYYESLKKKTPVRLDELTAIEGLGPHTIRTLYAKLGIKTRADLERAARKGAIRQLAGFGEKTEENILKSIDFAKRSGGRFPLESALPEIEAVAERLRGTPGVSVVAVAGSIRRRKETVGDADILAVARDPKRLMDDFVSMPSVARVYAHGSTKSAVKIRSGIDVDLRVVPAESYGAALNYFTGSKDHNVALRKIAIAKGYKLNEYGLFRRVSRRDARIAGRTEREVYRALGLGYVEPEMRENKGEIERAEKHNLPSLVGYGDLRGDLQVQTDWTDGSASIETMARAAAKRGLEYIAITDHTKYVTVASGLDDKKFVRQWAEIDRVNKKLRAEGVACYVLKGVECDIRRDGLLDLKDDTLARFDVVGVAVHYHTKLSRRDQTERIIRAMRHPAVDVVFHPTGRIVGRRAAYDVDVGALIAAAKKAKVALEANGSERLDLKDDHIRRCVEEGVRIAVNSDAHAPEQFANLEYGIAQARRGWAEKKDVINARSLEKIKKFFKQ